MAILEVKAARGWSLAQTAQAFLVTPATIASWMKRLDEDGPSAFPFALTQHWPFCFWVAIVVDHFSRRVMGVTAF
jgi:transposase InsO family protein